MKAIAGTFSLAFFLSMAALADDAAPYLGEWSNGRGETLVITPRTLQFGSDKAVAYRDITQDDDDEYFVLQITAAGEVNALPGKFLRVDCDEDAMEMTSFDSLGDLHADENMRSQVTWYKETSAEEGPKKTATRPPRYTPPPGSAERKAIALALHAPCERDLKQDVVLKFLQLNVADDWAFAHVEPLRPNGGKIDFRATPFRAAVDEGMFDPFGEALLRKTKGKWRVMEWSFGGTDTARSEWIQTHRAPHSLLD